MSVWGWGVGDRWERGGDECVGMGCGEMRENTFQTLLMHCHLLLLLSSLSSPPSFSFASSSPTLSPRRRGGKYNHCRIHTKSEGGKTKFYLIDQMCFDSIYDLIVYYKVREEEKRGEGGREKGLSP